MQRKTQTELVTWIIEHLAKGLNIDSHDAHRRFYVQAKIVAAGLAHTGDWRVSKVRKV